MFSLRLICVFMLLCLAVQPNGALFDWLFGSGGQSSEDGDVEVLKDGRQRKKTSTLYPLMARVPFELNDADEKFLAAATEYSKSQLDVCHHKIMLGLGKSCVHLSEEEISKLSVNLFNCQSAVEGRTIYPCTSDMTLKECTKDMNQDTWNAYHIISNRARAVCYSTRQVQFRAKTEMTINKLMTTAEDQVLAMSALQDEQAKLGTMTRDTLTSVSTGHEHLLQQQNLLKNAQENIRNYVSSNLRDLAREKAMIEAGHKSLADMKNSIQENLEVARTQLVNHQEDRERNHLQIVKDLVDVQAKARLLFEEIDESTRKILKQHEAAASHYQESLNNLQLVNDRIDYILTLVEKVKGEIDGKLNWLVEIAGGTGVKMPVITTVVLHFCYFLFCAVAAAFVNAPPLTRIALLVFVPLNAFNEVKKNTSLDFGYLTLVLLASALLHFAIKLLAIWLTYSHQNLPIDALNGQPRNLEEPNRNTSLEYQRYVRVPRRSMARSDEDAPFVGPHETTPPQASSGIISAVLHSVSKIGSAVAQKRVEVGSSDSSSCENYEGTSPRPLRKRFTPSAAAVDGRVTRRVLDSIDNWKSEEAFVRRSPRAKMWNN